MSVPGKPGSTKVTKRRRHKRPRSGPAGRATVHDRFRRQFTRCGCCGSMNARPGDRYCRRCKDKKRPRV